MKKLLSLVLAMIMLLSVAPMALAADEPVELWFVSRSLGLSGTEDTEIIDFLEEKFNVDITWEVLPSTDYETITRNMIASGDWPDLMEFKVSNKQQLQGFIEDGMLTPLNDMLDQYGANLKAQRPEPGYWMTDEEGTIWTMACRNVIPETYMTIRQDWLDNLGLKMPTNLQELVEVAYAFTYNDPDQDGQKDTYGFGGPLDGNIYDIMMPIMSSFGVIMTWDYNPTTVGPKTYNYVPWRLTDNFKEAVRFFRDEVYAKGLCDPDFMVMSRQDYLNKKNADTYGIEYWYLTHSTPGAGWYGTFMETVPHAVLTPLDPMPVEGYKTVWPRLVSAPSPVGFELFLFSTCEHPEKVMQILDYIASDEGTTLLKYGFEGRSYTVDENGVYALTDTAKEEAAKIGLDMYTSVYWNKTMDFKNKSALYTAGLESIEPYLYYNFLLDYKYDGDESALGGILSSYTVTLMTDTSVDFDATWDQMKQEYFEMGGEGLLDAWNEYIIGAYGETYSIVENNAYLK